MCDITLKSLCFGFVEYFKPEDAAIAIQTFNRLKIQNKILKVAYARPSYRAIRNANLYVKGIPIKYTNTDLDNVFSPYGKIIESRIICDQKEECRSKGYGFVRFSKRVEAEKAIHHLNGAHLGHGQGGVGKPLLVQFTHRSRFSTNKDH
ncbi:hypothetical protein B566_EDAN016655 [Ephemera danica]|nr:hypothetical protein B566_EDAN016655 [Ephemera danica]